MTGFNQCSGITKECSQNLDLVEKEWCSSIYCLETREFAIAIVQLQSMKGSNKPLEIKLLLLLLLLLLLSRFSRVRLCVTP